MSRSVKRPAPEAMRRASEDEAPLPDWIAPQLCQLVDAAPSGPQWLHEIKLDGYRMAARMEGGRARLLTRTGLDWSEKYPGVVAALARVGAKRAYLDGELCGIGADGLPSFSQTQAASDGARGVSLVYYAFDCLHLDGRDTAGLPLVERKALLAPLVADVAGLQFNGHETGDGELIRKHAGALGFEGVVSKTVDAPYAPGNRGLWRKSKCLNRQEFVIVGWTDPEGSRPCLGALLLGFFTEEGRLAYAGRVGAGMPDTVLADLRRRLEPLARTISPLSAPPPRKTRFGSPLVLSRVHWVEPQLVAEVTYLTWTGDGLLRQTVFVGLRADKPARDVGRDS
ncbi:bifunctional non-homologous end joining protein LigD [Roseiarcus fermentans]|uniref:DNA ligase (ATP) n=1 Tax=Roseiarcus fermentans TaxID=1473586 RepID=A0A366FT01_9HYPH|nr:non-homologous end-joining DNA ligase [Roseiarcus fermentans]RBP17661.1 bifunctional non-homologous end joining protein LigD [Roseiarcus fermentans]